MAGAQIEIVANQIEAQRLGYQAISLTHYDDTVEPQIAAGSVVEIGGALFEFTALESITGLGAIAADSDVYIKLTVAGTSVTASGVTAPAPTWDTAKQGWYSGAERYSGGLYKDAGGNYTDKWLYAGGPDIRHGAIGADAVRTLQLQDEAVTGDKFSKAFGAAGSQAIAGGANWTPAAGVYLILSGTGTDVYLEIFDGASWRTSTNQFAGGIVVCDGANVRFSAVGLGATMRYLPL